MTANDPTTVLTAIPALCHVINFCSLRCEDLNLIDKESDDVLERIMDEKTASESKILHGHSGPVYGVSFSPDR